MRDNYEAPLLLIGHSLGGRAVISAARQIPEVAAVATIGAPADAEHVSKQFSAHIKTIEAEGEAELTLAGRPFTIKKQFLDDIREENDDIENLRVPLLVMHSPIDNIVLIKEAEKIYTRAKHPKSFVTLDTADHLLTNKDDAQYVAEMIAAWSHRYIDRASPIKEAEVASHAVKCWCWSITNSLPALSRLTITSGLPMSLSTTVAIIWGRIPTSMFWPGWVPVLP